MDLSDQDALDTDVLCQRWASVGLRAIGTGPLLLGCAMQADHGGPLELVRRLVAEPEHDRVAIERLLDTALAEDAAGNAYFAIWSGKPERHSWLSSVELRRSREGSRSLLILAIDGSVCVSPAEVVAEYGEPDGLSRPNPADPATTAPRGEPAMAMTYYTYARAGAGGALAFGFRETDVASCVGRVVFSRDGCLEVRPIPTNTQGQHGDVVRIGAGNIRESTVRPDGVSICRHRPRR